MKRMGMIRNVFALIFVAWACLFSAAHGAEPSDFNKKEEDAFYVAAKAYQDGFHDVSLVLFDKFLQTYVQSGKKVEAMIYIGQNYFQQEKYLKALDQFDALLKMPEAAGQKDKILYWLGEIYARGRDYRQASEYYQQLVNDYPDSFYFRPAYSSLARALLNDGKFKEAQDIYRRMLERFKDAATQEEASFGICEAYYRQRDFTQLKKELVKYLSVFSSSPNLGKAYFYLGEAEYYLEEYAEAIQAYQKCLEQAQAQDQIQSAQIGIGWSYLKMKRFDDAGRVFSRFGDENEVPGIVLGKAVVASGQGEYQDAIVLFDRVISLDKNEEYAPLAYYGKGEALYHLEHFEEAIIAYRISLDKLRLLSRWLGEPRELRDRILYSLGWAYLKVGDFESAQQEFQKVASFSSDKIFKLSALCQLGDVYQDSGEYDKAVQTYQDILKEYPDSVYNDYIQYQIGLTWLKSENMESAALALKKLIKEFPNSKLIDDANYFLGVIYFQKGDFGAARGQLETFRSEFKDSSYRPQGIFLLGETLLNLGEFKQAIEAFQSLVREAGAAGSLKQKAEYEIANAYSRAGNQAEANKRFSDFVTRYPDSPLTPNIILELGQSYVSLHDDLSARKYFERLIRNYPDNEFVGDAYIAIGETYLREGNTAAALKSFAQARESGRLDAAARAAILNGDVYFQKGDHAAAIKSYEDAIGLQTPWSQTAYMNLAAIAKEEKRYAEAIDFLEKASAIQGTQKTADIQFQIAELWEESGSYDRALEAYLNVHYLFEKDEAISAKALLRVARIYERMENWVELRRVLEKVASLDVPEAKYAREKLKSLNEKD
ncbi:hypothetical protein BU251_05255 [Candidatus Velamenicoccus archaeovorus]|uniref:Uncharacterized protein n=1 Tax=Velamenicoccus archaeovorus TaxID=1930593 RepID=A0A410P4R9_VELA1|nr:tetratricopeptide repeat protein [Candidatus Velamenicoccus archaeovorus]QAT17179.1 hypothetical protein BU251_05255 [Candidatus Velamenicoccus archaeovorus]